MRCCGRWNCEVQREFLSCVPSPWQTYFAREKSFRLDRCGELKTLSVTALLCCAQSCLDLLSAACADAECVCVCVCVVCACGSVCVCGRKLNCLCTVLCCAVIAWVG